MTHSLGIITSQWYGMNALSCLPLIRIATLTGHLNGKCTDYNSVEASNQPAGPSVVSSVGLASDDLEG